MSHGSNRYLSPYEEDEELKSYGSGRMKEEKRARKPEPSCVLPLVFEEESLFNLQRRGAEPEKACYLLEVLVAH